MLEEVEFSGFVSLQLLSMFLTLSTNIPMEIIGWWFDSLQVQVLKIFIFFHYFAYVLRVLL